MMQEIFRHNETFENTDILKNILAKGEYENCIFNACNFEGSNMSEFKFISCIFNGCNISLAKLSKTALSEVKFNSCKMLGLHFDNCNEFALSFSFDGCQLNHSSFYKTKIKKTIFKNSQLHNADFAEADLTSAVFENCDLMDASFDRTILEKADFRSSFNYSIDPESNRIKKAKFALSGLAGLLNKYDIEIEK